jgi:ComF family protein
MWLFFSQILQPASPCLLCRQPVSHPSGFCEPCRLDLPMVSAACPSCAMPTAPGAACHCLPTDWPFAAVLCATYYAFPVDRLIWRYKEEHRLDHARPLASLMVSRIRRHNGPRPDLLVPVPAAPHRLRARGFDQALELARACGRQLGIPVRHDLFQRRADRQAQKQLNARQRESHMADAFIPGRLRGLPGHVALVDDVLTTGATVRQLAALLHRAGVREVEVWTLARVL